MQLTMLHRRAVEYWVSRVAAIGAEQWDHVTPCSQWSVRDLVNHVVGEELWTEPLLRGLTIEEVGDRFAGDVLGADPLTTARDAAEAAVAVVDAIVPAGGTVHLSFGQTDMGEYVRQLSADHLIHGWDLAVATGGDSAMEPDLVDEVAGWFRLGRGCTAAPEWWGRVRPETTVTRRLTCWQASGGTPCGGRIMPFSPASPRRSGHATSMPS